MDCYSMHEMLMLLQTRLLSIMLCTRAPGLLERSQIYLDFFTLNRCISLVNYEARYYDLLSSLA